MRSLAFPALISLLCGPFLGGPVDLIRLEPDPTRSLKPNPARYQISSTTISGRVVSDNTGEPLPNVRITVTAVESGAPIVLTDADGRFSLLVPGGGTLA